MPRITRNRTGRISFSIPENQYIRSWNWSPTMTVELTLTKPDHTTETVTADPSGTFKLGKLEDGIYSFEIIGKRGAGFTHPKHVTGNINVSGNSLPNIDVTDTPVAAGPLPADTAEPAEAPAEPVEPESATIKKTRLVAQNQQALRVDFEAEHERLTNELRMMDLEAEDRVQKLTDLITTPVTEVGKGIRKNILAQKITETIDALETEKQKVAEMAAENIGGQMLNFQQQISQLEEMSQEKIDKTMPLEPSEQTAKIRKKHGNPLGNIWSAYRHSIGHWRDTQKLLNKRTKALHSEISKFQEEDISNHQANLTQLEDQLKEYETSLQSIADQLPTATERKRITQLQNGIGTLIQKHKKRNKIKELQSFEKKLTGISKNITKLFGEKKKLKTQQKEHNVDRIEHLKHFIKAKTQEPKK